MIEIRSAQFDSLPKRRRLKVKDSLPALLSLVFVMGVAVPLGAQIHLSGPLSGVLSGETYIVDDSIYVPIGQALVIEPGAQFLFNGYFNFRIYGYLRAEGTAADSIFFEPAPGADSLRSITFHAGSADSSRLAYSRIAGCAESAVNVYSADVTITHCTITGNTANWGGGIYCSGANATITECVITDNVCRNNGGGIYCTNASPIINNCIVTGNLCNTLPTTSSGRGGGGICANHSASPVITGCVISDNRSIWNGGGLSFNDSSDVILSHCLIADNSCDSSGGGILISAFCESVVRNCTISGNTAAFNGGGIHIYQSSPYIQNTIIVGSEGNGGIYFEQSPTTSVAYCDLFNPATENLAGEPGALPDTLGIINATNANGDSCDGLYNIYLDPLLVNASGGNYQLQIASPCIDAGDPTSPLDPDFTFADLGAYFYYQHVIPAMALSTDSLIFPPVIIGLGDALPLIISNSGDAILVIRNISSSESVFSSDFDPSDSLILPGNQLEIAVSFEPTDCTEYLGVLSIDNNDTLAQAWLHGFGVTEVGVNDHPQNLPAEFAVFGPYPNPFNARAAISFQLPAVSYVNLKVYDTAGRLVATLVDGWRAAGSHEVTFDPKGAGGAALVSGIYIYCLQTGEFSLSGKMALMK
jgi:parallel beta-helix repeat protein/predicted outer membrane repeat protein